MKRSPTYWHDWYIKRKSAGICARCSNKALPNRVYCQKCNDKQKERDRLRQINNPEQMRKKHQAWRAKNKEKWKALYRAWQKANPDKLKAYAENFKKTHPNYQKEYQKARYQANKEEFKKKFKINYQKRKIKLRIYFKERRKERIKAGFCSSCGSRKARKGLRSCQICVNRSLEYTRKHRLKINKRQKEQYTLKKQTIKQKKEDYLRRIDEKIKIGLLKEIQANKDLLLTLKKGASNV